MDDSLQDERIQFFLRHRDDIRAWAAIERDLPAIVREILARSQTTLDERLATVDPTATTSRRDGERWERIVVGRPTWPDRVGITLEWEKAVDPFGSVLPKIGVIFLNEDPAVQAARLRMIELCKQDGRAQAQGYRIDAEHNWPLLRRVEPSRDWWRDPDAWTDSIVDRVIGLWGLSAAAVDQALGASVPTGQNRA